MDIKEEEINSPEEEKHQRIKKMLDKDPPTLLAVLFYLLFIFILVSVPIVVTVCEFARVRESEEILDNCDKVLATVVLSEKHVETIRVSSTVYEEDFEGGVYARTEYKNEQVTRYYTKLEYTAFSDGKTYTSTMDLAKKYSEGSTMSIYVNRYSPSIIKMTSGLSKKFSDGVIVLDIILGVIVFVLLQPLIYWTILFIRKRIRNKKRY